MGESRCSRSRYDGIVVGSGPNGLSAAITLAREGRSVLVIEAASTVGGGTRTAPLTLPGFVHDVCSAVHPFAVASPFLKTLPLAEHGLELIHPSAPLAHPLDDGTTAVLERSIEETARSLGPDERSYRRLMEPLAADADRLFSDLLGPLRLPRHPISAARFGLRAIQPATMLASRWFSAPRPAPCSPAWPPTRSCRWNAGRPPRSAWCWASPVTRSAGRLSVVVPRESPTVSRPTCIPSAARSSPVGGSSRSTSCPMPAPCCSTSRLGRSSRWPVIACPPVTSAASTDIDTEPVSSSWTGP